MQFQIPQFIDNETLLLGPLTVTQSMYIGAAIIGAFFAHAIFDGAVAWMISGVLIVSGLALSFIKIEGRSLPTVIKNFFVFSQAPKLYIWEMKFSAPRILKMEKKKKITKVEKKYTLSKDRSKNRLSDLSFELNIEGEDIEKK
jgi:hypothetical protein